MNKLWSILFGVVMMACGLSFVFAPAMGWWLPEGVSTHAAEVDFLFYVILWITGFFFFLTEAILVGFMFYYSGEPGTKPVRATDWPGLFKPLGGVLHDAHRIEMAWTLIPALILLYIAFAQIGTWENIKYQTKIPKFGEKDKDGKYVVPLPIEVSARQFEWRTRYPHPDRLKQWLDPANGTNPEIRKDFESFARNPQYDDVHGVNELHLWKMNPTVVYLSTRDVIHSFNIPVMRVKQDALPGKVIPIWFKSLKANTAWDEQAKDYVDEKEFDEKQVGKVVHNKAYRWDLPCAELCGWGHYRMIGRVYVHDTEKDFLGWLEKTEKEAHARTGSR